MSGNIPLPRYKQSTITLHLNSPTSVSYSTLFFFWVHLQEVLEGTTSDFYIYTVATYHFLAHTITKAVSPTSAEAITRASMSSSDSTGALQIMLFMWPHTKYLAESNQTNVVAEKDLLVRVMATVQFGLSGFRYRVYQNMVHR